MPKYILKIEASKNRNLRTSKNVQKSIEDYLGLALGCEVKLLQVREMIDLNQKDKEKHKKIP